MNTMTLDEFREKHCSVCGSQLCGGVDDEPFRDGCKHYQREVLGQLSLDITTHNLNYNPVARAYEVLYGVFTNKHAGWDEAEIAIEEAIGYLGEALAG